MKNILKVFILLLSVLCITLTGCSAKQPSTQISNQNSQSTLDKGTITTTHLIPAPRLSSFAKYFLDDITSISQIIVKGTVKNITDPRWNNTENKMPQNIQIEDTIYTDVTLSVSQVLKGDTKDKEVIFRMFKGRVNNFNINNDLYPQINPGDEIYVFLNDDTTLSNKDKKNDHYILTGVHQGIFLPSGSDVKNFNEKFALNDFLQKVQYYISNPKPTSYGMSDE